MRDAGSKVTELLRAWNRGESGALDELIPVVQGELREMARRHFARERRDHTLQPTALINEAYLRLVDQRQVRWQDRAHFFAIAARMMRRILTDHARRKRARKREGIQVTLDVPVAKTLPARLDALDVDRVLERLAALDARQAEIVELRFFGGLSVKETAELLGIAPATVKRDWSTARAFLYRELTRNGRDGS